MQETRFLCDCCGSAFKQKYDFSISVGAFHGKEIILKVSLAQGGPGGPDPWLPVDVCDSCKNELLKFVGRRWLTNGEIFPHEQTVFESPRPDIPVPPAAVCRKMADVLPKIEAAILDTFPDLAEQP